MTFAVCDGIECIGGSSELANLVGQEFAQNANTISSASQAATNDSLPAVAQEGPVVGF